MSVKKATSFDSFLLTIKADRVLRQITNKIVREQGEVTFTEWLLLSIIAVGPKEGLRMTNLAAELGVTLPQVTALLDSLLVKRLVRQKTLKKDRRNRYAIATQKGEDVVKAINKAMDEAYGSIMHGVPGTHLQIYEQVMGVVVSRDKADSKS